MTTVLAGRPLIIGHVNWAAGATVTATSEAAGFPASRLTSPRLSVPWRSTGVASAQSVTADLGAAREVQALVLFGANLTDAATVRGLVDDEATFAAPQLADTGTNAAFDLSLAGELEEAPAWGRPVTMLLEAPVVGRYVRITSTDTANPAGYIRASYMVAGPVLSLGPAVWTVAQEWSGPAGAAVQRAVYTITWRGVGAAARREALALSAAGVGVGRFGLVLMPATPADWLVGAVLCRLRSPVAETPLPGQRWDITLVAEEVTD